MEELEVAAIAVDSGFRSLDSRDTFDLARAGVLKLATAAGDLDVLNGAPGAAPYEDLRAHSISATSPNWSTRHHKGRYAPA